MTRITSTMLLAAVALLAAVGFSDAFVSPSRSMTTARVTPAFAKQRKQKEDLSYLETRDLTKEEMFEINKRAEETMNQELASMTAFSLIISLPILYLCWVAFFSD